MSFKDLRYKEQSREALERGINKVADAVKVTLGPKGRVVVMGRQFGGPAITKDGVSVAKDIKLEDPFENLGAQLIQEVASKTNDETGDGPQPLYSKILTPNGFVEMGSLKIGDKICGTNGSIQEVVGIFPKGIKQVFKI